MGKDLRNERLATGSMIAIAFALSGCGSSRGAAEDAGGTDSSNLSDDSGSLRDASESDASPSDGAATRDASAKDATFVGDAADASEASAGPCSAAKAAPVQAAAVGYTLQTYGPSLDVKTLGSGTGCGTFYPWNIFSSALGTYVKNSDGSVTVSGGNNSYNAQLATVYATSGSPGVVGTAFGGGAYFEAVVKFTNWEGSHSDPSWGKTGWPAFWSDPIEGIENPARDQWPGQAAGYANSTEVDFFEYDSFFGYKSDDFIGCTIHDWYGPSVPYKDVANGQGLYLPTTTNFSDYNTYGTLWVPATATTDGYLEYYFNDVAIGTKVTWPELPATYSPPPIVGSTAFGVLDKLHLYIILGTGTQAPMTVQSVSVYQSSTANNVTY